MKDETALEWVGRFILFAIATPSAHFGLGLPIWVSVIIGLLCAFFGVLFIVFVFDGDGSLW